MLAGTEITLKALTGLASPTITEEAEYLIVFESGRLFVTGGYEDAESLRKSIFNRDSIHGSYYWQGNTPWQDTIIQVNPEAIIDLRTDSSGDGE